MLQQQCLYEHQACQEVYSRRIANKDAACDMLDVEELSPEAILSLPLVQ